MPAPFLVRLRAPLSVIAPPRVKVPPEMFGATFPPRVIGPLMPPDCPKLSTALPFHTIGRVTLAATVW